MRIPVATIIFARIPIVIFCTLLASCVGFTRDISKDQRFARTLNGEITTKREMRLYYVVPETSRQSMDVPYRLTEGEAINDPDLKPIATIRPGHSVRFERVYSKTVSGETQEWMNGAITFKGEVYRIEYFLGFTGYGGFTGWKRLYKSFALGPVPEG